MFFRNPESLTQQRPCTPKVNNILRLADELPTWVTGSLWNKYRYDYQNSAILLGKEATRELSRVYSEFRHDV